MLRLNRSDHRALSTLQPLSASLIAVRPVVRRCWGAVVELASDVYFGRTIGHADVSTALGLTDDGGPYSAELSRIRNRGAPGSFTVTRPVV